MNFLFGEPKPTHGELMLIELIAGQGRQIEAMIEEIKQLQLLVSKLTQQEQQDQELKVLTN